MSIASKIISFFLPFLLAFLIHQSESLTPFLPQIVALTSLIIVLLLVFVHRFFIPLVVFILNLIVFSTGGISSFLFFLVYFLLFSLSFQSEPSLSLIYSLITIILYSSSVSSTTTLIQLFSLLLITPLTYFISHEQETSQKTESVLTEDETDFLLWISLHLKSSLKEIISLSDNPKIDKIAKDLLKNSAKLGRTIDQNSDEI